MSKVRFIHTSDIHLGSLLHVTGDVPEDIEKLSFSATNQAFENICTAAVEEAVDFIVISGDLYDREARSVKSTEFFVNRCRRLADEKIHVYVIAGNHDPSGEQQELFSMPENVTVIGSEAPELHIAVNKKGEEIARVIGQSYRWREDSRKMHKGYEPQDTRLTSIALLHTQLEAGNSSYVPCSISELKEVRGIDYWALGHIHRRKILNASQPVIAYSGIPQGRDINEEGTGGCYLVELSSTEQPRMSFIPTSPVVWARLELSLDKGEEPRNINELEEIMFEKAKEYMARFAEEDRNEAGRTEAGRTEAGQTEEGQTGIEHTVTSTDENGNYIIKNRYFKGCIVQWILKGRIDLHNTLAQQGTEVVSLLAENLRQRFRNKRPFLWTDSIELQTAGKLDFEQMKKGSKIFEEIDTAFEAFSNNGELKRALISKFGQVIEYNADPENYNEHRIQINDETYSEILQQAREMILEKLYEGRASQ